MSYIEGGMLPNKINIEEDCVKILERPIHFQDIKQRSKGLLFRHDELVYLYKYTPCGSGDYTGVIRLIDKRSFAKWDDDKIAVFTDEIIFVEIIQTPDGYVLTEIFKLEEKDVDDWVKERFGNLFETLWAKFQSIKHLLEE